MKRAILAIALLLLALAVAAGALVWSGLCDRVGKADVALVLGNTVNPDGTPSARLKARLDTALDCYRKGMFPLILVSGGTGKEGLPEGTAMKNYLVKNGVPAPAIVVDDQGVDTRASAKNTAALLSQRNLKSVFVITQYFHVPRSRLALRKQGVSDIYSAHPSFFEVRDIYSIFRELPAYVKYLVRPPQAEEGGGGR